MMMYRGLGRVRIRLFGRGRRGGIGRSEQHLLRNKLDLHLLDRSKHHLDLLDWNELPSLDLLLVHPLLDHLQIDQFLSDQLLFEPLRPDLMPRLVSWTIPPLLELRVIKEKLDRRRRYHPSNPPPLYPMLVFHRLRKSSLPTTSSLFSHGDDGLKVLVREDLFLRSRRLQSNLKPVAVIHHPQTNRKTLARTSTTLQIWD